MAAAGLILPILAMVLYRHYGAGTAGAGGPAKLWHLADLEPYSGNLPDAPMILLACMGEVFDVTTAPQFYGPQGGYRNFTGRDGSRAFIKGEFKADGCVDDVSDFSPTEMHGLEDWRQFYHKTYIFKGVLAGGAFYDARGKPRALYRAVKAGAKEHEKNMEERKKAEKLAPACSSRWEQGKGGEVWCTQGYPRKDYTMGADYVRCACFMDLHWGDDRKLYDGCNPDQHLCKTGA